MDSDPPLAKQRGRKTLKTKAMLGTVEELTETQRKAGLGFAFNVVATLLR